MSRIDEMIQRLCPDGVEYKKLSEVATIGGGHTPSKARSEFYDNGTIPWVTSKDVKTDILFETGIRITPAAAEKLTLFPKGTIVVVVRSGILKRYLPVAMLAEPMTVNQDIKAVNVADEGVLLPRFLFYCIKAGSSRLLNEGHRAGGTVDSVPQNEFKNLLVPVPPLDIQHEVVRVLDSFAELEAELQAELQARKAQYAHYRDRSLSRESLEEMAGGKVSVIELGDLMTVQRGASPRPIKQFVTDDPNGIPWIKIGDVASGAKYICQTKEKITEAGAKRSRYLEPGSFVLSNSMSFGRPYILQLGGCVHDGWISITGYEDHFSTDFLYHLLNSYPIQKYWDEKASSGTVRNLNSDIVRTTPLLVPPLHVQQRVIDILDRFDALTTSLTDGLPAEIEARRQQYEYYRDKLFDFPRKEA